MSQTHVRVCIRIIYFLINLFLFADRDLAQYVGHVIGNVHADITNRDIEGHAGLYGEKRF